MASSRQLSNSKPSHRRPWSSEEDLSIRELVRLHGTKQWTLVSDKLETEYGITGRTGKQCRERWHNHLDPAIFKGSWSVDEELKLFESHQALGNQWANISNQLPGRSDNAIKNHFYSTMRKQYRKLFGSEASLAQLKAQDATITQALVNRLSRRRKAKNHCDVTKAGVAPKLCDIKQSLQVTGTHLDLPRPCSPVFCFDESPAEFCWLNASQDLFELEEVLFLPWGFKPSDSYSIWC